MCSVRRGASPTHPTIDDVKERHEMELLGIEGVEGVGIGEKGGRKFIQLYISDERGAVKKKLPDQLEGYPVKIVISGKLKAL